MQWAVWGSYFVNLVSWSSSTGILVSSGHDESLGWFDATGPWLALRIAAAWPRNLGHWRGGTTRWGEGGKVQGRGWYRGVGRWVPIFVSTSYLLQLHLKYSKVAVLKLCRHWKPRTCGDFDWLLHILRCDSPPDLFRLDPVMRAGSWVNRIVLLTGRVWGPKRWDQLVTGDPGITREERIATVFPWDDYWCLCLIGSVSCWCHDDSKSAFSHL